MDAQRTELQTSAHNQVLGGLKGMVAVARCNKHAMSTPSITAHAIHKFAVALHDEFDRCKMIEFLEEVNSTGWPTADTIGALRETWQTTTDAMVQRKEEANERGEGLAA